MNLAALTTLINARPTPTNQQYADARRVVETNAPDLAEMIFGDNTKEN